MEYLILSSPSVTKDFCRASGLMNRSPWVMLAGCSIKDSTPPRETANWNTRRLWNMISSNYAIHKNHDSKILYISLFCYYSAMKFLQSQSHLKCVTLEKRIDRGLKWSHNFPSSNKSVYLSLLGNFSTIMTNSIYIYP